jgi:hypothetical protein
MALEIIGFILASSHVLTVAILLLWFGLGKPTSRAQFTNRFKEQMLGIKTPKRSFVSKTGSLQKTDNNVR